MKTLREAFVANSSLNFTCKRSIEGKLLFLDIQVKQENGGFHTQVYVKPAKLGQCPNGDSECTQKYEDSVIDTFVRRALTNCTSWSGTHQELDRVSQNLINNGCSNNHINNSFKNALNRWYRRPTTPPHKEGNIRLYYRAFMSFKYKEEEKIIKSIVNSNVTSVDYNRKINLVIHYKNSKMKNLLMKNHPKLNEGPLKECMVVNRFTCPIQGYPGSYIGMTIIRLSKRISCHLQEGAIFRHYKNKHHTRPTWDALLKCVEIAGRADNDLCLCIKEASFIEKEKNTLNTTDEVKILPTSMMRPSRQPDSE